MTTFVWGGDNIKMDNKINKKLSELDTSGWLGTGFSVGPFWIHNDEKKCVL
jgi:hypothetical protein